MFFSVDSFPARPAFRRFVLLAVAGMTVGYAAEAGAIDRTPFQGGFVSDAHPGYGSERPGYGAEREYYGAENGHSKRGPNDRHELTHYRSQGSIIEFADEADETFESDVGAPLRIGGGPGVYPGLGGAADGSFLYFGDAGRETDEGVDLAAAAGARVIDVESERLDRRPVGPSGIDVHYSGGAKIIRIASSGTAASAASPARADAAPALKPWSDGWSRYCKRAHPGFDPERGTFTGADGTERFCTGD